MGNAVAREAGDKSGEDDSGRFDQEEGGGGVNSRHAIVAGSVESMGQSPPDSPSRSRSPVMFGSQAPVAPLQFPDSSAITNQQWKYHPSVPDDFYYERRVPTLITWSYGGNDVAVEGSWDNWTSRKPLHRAGKDFTTLMVLPLGVYHYKFIVDGEWRYVPDLPWMTDDTGSVHNILDVKDYVPENLESVAEFEPPESPDSSYTGPFPAAEDFNKEPPAVPSHLHLTLLNTPNSDASEVGTRPQHVILNHLYVEKTRSSQSVLALGLTHRYRSKYVTVVLYKPFKGKAKK